MVVLLLLQETGADIVAILSRLGDAGWFVLGALILYFRYKKVWVDGPTYTSCEDRAVAAESRLEAYRLKAEELPEKQNERIDRLLKLLPERYDES